MANNLSEVLSAVSKAHLVLGQVAERSLFETGEPGVVLKAGGVQEDRGVLIIVLVTGGGSSVV